MLPDRGFRGMAMRWRSWSLGAHRRGGRRELDRFQHGLAAERMVLTVISALVLGRNEHCSLISTPNLPFLPLGRRIQLTTSWPPR